MMNSTNKFAHWWFRLTKFEFPVVFCAGLKSQTVEAHSCLQTIGKENAPLKYDFSSLAEGAKHTDSSVFYSTGA